MYRTLLVALDGSANAEKVLPIVEPLLRERGAKALLFQVLPQVEPCPEAAIRVYLESVAGRLRQSSLASEPVTARGEPAAAIVDTALKRRCELVAFTTHGRTGAERWIYGSVAEKVLRSCPVPLLVVRGLESPTSEVKQIVVPLDGSPGSETVLPHAGEFARLLKAPCTLVHVLEPLGIEANDSKLAGWLNKQKLLAVGRLEAAAQQLRSRGLEVSVAMLEGDPATQILAAAAKAPSLIAMSSHGRSGFSRWVMGSVAEKVLQGAVSPVLVVRHAEAAVALEEAARAAPLA